jgi:tetratricopeptide (TPR) repeat protein
MLGLLDRLDRDIAQSRLPRELPLLRAERSILLSRLGEFERARQDIKAMKASPDIQGVPALGAWLWLSEGLFDYFETMNERARARVQRALALARSAKSPRILALSAAWCAHVEHRAGDTPAMTSRLVEALTAATPDNHGALARACVITAAAYHGFGTEAEAQPWYTRARSHASQEGDGVTLSSIMYNMAALRITNARLDEHFGTLDRVIARRALLGAESSTHLDMTVHTTALAPLSWIQRAQILCVLDEFSDALQLYEQHYDNAINQGLVCEEAQMQADRAWCLYRLGRSDEARVVARSAAAALTWATEVDSKAIAHAQLGRTFDALGLTEESAVHAVEARRMYTLHRECAVKVCQALNDAQLNALYLRVVPSNRPAGRAASSDGLQAQR